jgi:BrnA antitoxin of type II toxin-antitoxin system
MLGQSEIMSIKAGTLYDIRTLVPVGHIWTKSKQAWVSIHTTGLQYDEEPTSFEELFSAWRAAHA